ncbi:YciI family protein [Rhizobium rhizoryzae]|uniref:YCII-related domain-containing protein n=1 Tax=Rhizobium rhizoryzae TaxID=451876 RepID=A0A7W6LM67_9HYPH|nr:YciI family protein [Rhizobium rhizoryzae]MBB4145646.1 hypothetical protein [Rhizobium rhizoryzae]
MIGIRVAFSDASKLEERTKFHPQHKAHLSSAPFRVLISGPASLENSEATDAAFLVAEVDTLQDLKAFSDRDPFVVNKVYKDVRIFEWKPSLGDLVKAI